MGNILISSIVTKVRDIALDEDSSCYRWSDSKLAAWYNEAVKEIVRAVPNSNSRVDIIPLVYGSMQHIPANYAAVLSFGRNMGVNGTTPGKIPRFATKDVMDSTLPTWQQMPTSTVVDVAMLSELTPRLFYNYPPQGVTASSLEVVFVAYPIKISESGLKTEKLELDDIYEVSVIEYMLHRLFDRDSDYPGNLNRSNEHLQKYLASIGKAAQQAQQQ